MELQEIRHLLKELRKELGIEEEVKVKLKPMKRKVATISLRSREIRLNSNLIGSMSEGKIREILLHELLHLKHGIFHTRDFMEEFERFKTSR